MAYQFLRGTKAQNDAYTGPEGSLTVDLESNNVRVHDGVTAGGKFAMAISDLSISYTGTTVTITGEHGQSVTINPATALQAGLLTGADKTKLDSVEANAEPNDPTNLSTSYAPSSVIVASSTGTDATITSATPSAAGVLSASDKSKLDGVEAGAEVNTVDSVAGRTGDVTLLKSDVSLENVLNYGVASQALAEAGTSNAAYMTPLRTTENVQAQTGIENEGTYTRKRSDEVYWFFAYRSSTVVVTGGSTLVFNAQETGSRGYSTSTGVFTAPVAGVYRFHAQVLRQGGYNTNGLNMMISKNSLTTGTGAIKSFAEKTGTTSDNGIIQCNTEATFVLAAGDTVKVILGDTVQVNGDTTNIYTHFQGYLI